MHDTTALARPASPYNPADNPRFSKLHRRFPTVAYLRRHARRQVPSFAFEYMDGGAGADGGIARNSDALDAVELVPRYGDHHRPAARRRRIVRPALRRADRCRADGRPFARMARRRSISRGRGATRARALHARARRRDDGRAARPRSRPTCSGSSSIAVRATTTRSASISSAARRRPACMSWC